MEKAKLYKILNSLLIFSFAVVAFYFLFSLFENKADQILPYLSHINFKEKYYLLGGAFLLVFANWFLEGLKWSRLINAYLFFSDKMVIKSLLAGISMGLFTPNRVGELGGRLLYVSKNERSRVLYLSAISSMSQLLLTLLIGLMGLNYFYEDFSSWLPMTGKGLFLCLSLLITLFLLLVYFTMEGFRSLHCYIFTFLKKKIMHLPKVSLYSKLQLLFWSLLRYQVFVLQFYLFMLCFSFNAEFIPTYFALSIIYLLSSLIPSSALTEIPVRVSLSYFIFDVLALNPEAALLSSVGMWVINLFVPALAGVYLLKDIQIFPIKKAMLVK